MSPSFWFKNLKKLIPAFLLLAVGSAGYAQSQDSLTVEARKWNRDKNRQVVYSDWLPFKSMTVDRLPGFQPRPAPSLSRYGGDASRKWEATGFIRTQLEKGRWWLVDPEGHPMLTVAVNSIRPAPSETSRQAFAQNFASPQDWLTKTQQLLEQNGFNGAGSWSDIPAIQAYNRQAERPITYATMFNFLTTFAKEQAKTRPASRKVPNPALVFEPEWTAFCNSHAEQADAYREDANVLGHFSDNEIPFSATLLTQLLALRDPTQPAYAATLQWLQTQQADSAHLTDELKDAFVGFVAAKYYQAVGPALKKHDPNHLYLGTRLHGAAKFNRAIFTAAEPYVDLVSINFYGRWQPDLSTTAQWADWTTKPFFITEFYTKAEDSGLSNVAGAGWLVHKETDRGIHYQTFGLSLLKARNCVGWHWFRYQDNDPSEPGTDKPDMGSNKGIVDTKYQPYPRPLAAMKTLNQNVFGLIDFFDQKIMAKKADTCTRPDPNFHVYLLMGQSNMAGRGPITEALKNVDNARVFMLNASGEWVPARHPLHFDKPKVVGVGPGLSFGVAMAEANPNVRIGLVPCAVGGTSISRWQPGAYDEPTKTHPYDDAVQRIENAMRCGVVKGMLWHQGESDSNPADAAVYLPKLAELIARIRKLTGQPDLPVVAGELGQYKEVYKPINAELQKLSSEVPHTALATSEGLADKGDHTHFDGASADEYGRRYATRMLKLQAVATPAPRKDSRKDKIKKRRQ